MCEAKRGRLFVYAPVSSSSPFIHRMDAAGLLPMAVQVSSVSLPSLTTSSRLSMIGLPGGTDPQQQTISNAMFHIRLALLIKKSLIYSSAKLSLKTLFSSTLLFFWPMILESTPVDKGPRLGPDKHDRILDGY